MLRSSGNKVLDLIDDLNTNFLSVYNIEVFTSAVSTGHNFRFFLVLWCCRGR